ncbi:hypothetical protein FJTKL_09099 [Diaporthe vaccinii]|uniref:Cytochrome P450 n=1 Tax=Diaporthe vaccinii TaxID=105482 RepID=A0ABR4ENV5_9PEZI
MAPGSPLGLVAGLGFTSGQWAGLAFATVAVYAATRCVYLLYFHPLSRYPGPRLAAVSSVWRACHWLGGRYPWAIARVLDQYGDVVRIGPNEVVFMSPKASEDIYDSHTKHLEHFTRTAWLDLGEGED